MTGSILAVLMLASVVGTMLFLYLGALTPRTGIPLEKGVFLIALAFFVWAVTLFTQAFSVFDETLMFWLTVFTSLVLGAWYFLIQEEIILPRRARMGYETKRKPKRKK